MELRMKSNFHKDIIFSSPIRVRRMGEAGWGSGRLDNSRPRNYDLPDEAGFDSAYLERDTPQVSKSA